jgi:hypothetical protein
VLLVVFRPVSEATTSAFFADMTGVLDRVAQPTELFFIAGDSNIQAEASDELNTLKLVNIYPRDISDTASTHDLASPRLMLLVEWFQSSPSK